MTYSFAGVNGRRVLGDGFGLTGVAEAAGNQLKWETDSLSLRGQPLVWVVAHQGDEKVWDRFVQVLDEADCEEAIADAKAVTGSEGERRLLDAITSRRATWMKEKDTRIGHDDFLANAIDSATFAKTAYSRDWLIKGLLVKGQPVIMGGPHKVLKTSLVVDLAVSLGTGQAFLGHFDVPEKVRVLVLSGESGDATMKDTAERVCRTKNIGLAKCDVIWNFDLPQLTRDSDLGRLGEYIRDKGVQVVVLDPLYLCMSGVDASAANVFAAGELLRGVARSCHEAGATVILVHHTGKTAGLQKASAGEPIELTDLAYSGFSEFARQWLLISRRERYQGGSGVHKLWLNHGGSAGQSGLYGVDVEEGTMDLMFGGRQWSVKVLSTEETRKETVALKEKQREKKAEEDLMAARRAVCAVLRANEAGETANRIKDLVSCKKALVGLALLALKNDGMVIETTVKKDGGRGQRDYRAWCATKMLLNGKDISEAPAVIARIPPPTLPPGHVITRPTKPGMVGPNKADLNEPSEPSGDNDPCEPWDGEALALDPLGSVPAGESEEDDQEQEAQAAEGDEEDTEEEIRTAGEDENRGEVDGPDGPFGLSEDVPFPPYEPRRKRS